MEMFALTSYPAPPYPYGFIVVPLMIAALTVSIVLFARCLSLRKYVLPFTAVLGLVDFWFSASIPFGEGAWISFITLTCAGIMAVFHFTKTFSLRVVGGLFFAALGFYELHLPLDYMYYVVRSLNNLPWFVLMLSLALTTLAGGILILIVAVKKRERQQK